MTKNNLFWACFISVTAIIFYFFFRTLNLNSLPVFVDEAIYIRWSQVMKSEPSLRFLPLSDGKQPLFMWATMPFFKVFSDPLIAGRVLSVFAGLGSLIGLGLLAHTLFANIFISLFTVFIYATVPYAVFFDRMALADSMLAMFGVWTLLFAVRFSVYKKTEDAMFLGFAIGAGLLTKSPAMVYYIWSLIAIGFFSSIRKLELSKIFVLLWGVLLTLIISQAMYGILRLGEGFHMIGSRNMDYVFSVSEVLSHPLSPLIDNLKRTGSWLFLLFTPTVLILAAIGYLNPKHRKTYLFLLLISAVPVFFQAFVAKVYTSRYAFYALLPLLPLAGLGAQWLFSRKGVLIKASLAIFIAVPVLVSYFYVFHPTITPMPYDMHTGYLEEWTAGWGQKQIAEYLISEESKGNKIVVFTEGFFGTLPDGLQIYTEGHPNITIVGSKPIVDEIPQGLVNTSEENLRFFVVNKSRNRLSPEEVASLELIQEFPKSARLDGTREYLQFFRLK